MQNLPQQVNLAAAADVLKMMVDNQEALDEIELQLLGMIKMYDKDGKKILKQAYTPYIKAIHINELMTPIRSLFRNKNLIFTHFSEKDVMDIQHQIDCMILDLLTMNFIKWELAESNLDVIYVIVTAGTYGILRRSLFGQTLKAFTEMTEHSENIIRQEQGKEQRTALSGSF